MLNSKDLEDFLDIQPSAISKGSKAEVSMVAGNKLTIAKSGLEHLGISLSEIKNVRLLLTINAKTKELMIKRSPSLNLGYLLSGKPSKPEVYCSDKCDAILNVMHKYLTGSGTVRFLSVAHEEYMSDTDATIPVLLVDLNSASANKGALEERED